MITLPFETHTQSKIFLQDLQILTSTLSSINTTHACESYKFEFDSPNYKHVTLAASAQREFEKSWKPNFRIYTPQDIESRSYASSSAIPPSKQTTPSKSRNPPQSMLPKHTNSRTQQNSSKQATTPKTVGNKPKISIPPKKLDASKPNPSMQPNPSKTIKPKYEK